MVSIKSLSRYWILILVGGLIACLLMVAYFSGLFATDAFCLFSPGAAADGEATAKVLTWTDLNGNRVPDAGEPPLPWVSVQLSYDAELTNAVGAASLGVFKPGCACRCWEHESVQVVIPPGYRATTPTEFALKGAETLYNFGFQVPANTQPPSFAGEPDWSHALINSGLTITAFHFSDSDRYLTVTIKNDAGQDPELIYYTLFKTINLLADANITIWKVTITLTPPNEISTCSIDTINSWQGKITYSKTVQSYCSHP